MRNSPHHALRRTESPDSSKSNSIQVADDEMRIIGEFVCVIESGD